MSHQTQEIKQLKLKITRHFLKKLQQFSVKKVIQKQQGRILNTIIFTDGIPKGTKMHKLNRLIKNRKPKMFYFPCASSHQLLHYLDAHLKDKSIDTLIIHIGINDLLTNSSRSCMDNLIYNIKKMFGVKSVFISGWVYTTRIDFSLFERTHALIFDFCRKNSFIYIDNWNIRSDSLYKYGLHLIDKGKVFFSR